MLPLSCCRAVFGTSLASITRPAVCHGVPGVHHAFQPSVTASLASIMASLASIERPAVRHSVPGVRRASSRPSWCPGGLSLVCRASSHLSWCPARPSHVQSSVMVSRMSIPRPVVRHGVLRVRRSSSHPSWCPGRLLRALALVSLVPVRRLALRHGVLEVPIVLILLFLRCLSRSSCRPSWCSWLVFAPEALGLSSRRCSWSSLAPNALILLFVAHVTSIFISFRWGKGGGRKREEGGEKKKIRSINLKKNQSRARDAHYFFSSRNP